MKAQQNIPIFLSLLALLFSFFKCVLSGQGFSLFPKVTWVLYYITHNRLELFWQYSCPDIPHTETVGLTNIQVRAPILHPFCCAGAQLMLLHISFQSPFCI